MPFAELFILVVILGSSFGERSAPVLVWESTELSANVPSLPALPALGNLQLKNLLDSMDTEALIIFVMNELNVEDFSGYPESLQQLQKEFESSQHAFTPSMADPTQVPALLSSYSRVTVDLDRLASLKLAAGAQKTMFLVYLNDKPGADREVALRQSDAVIARVLAQVRTLTEKYSAVLTGKHTTMGGEISRRVTRSLKAAAGDDEMDGFINLGCVFIYTSSPPIMRFPGNSTDKKPQSVQLSLNASMITSNTSTCNNDSTQTATITWSDVTGPAGYSLDHVTLTYTFLGKLSQREGDPSSVSSWTLSDVTMTYNGTIAGATVQSHSTLDFSDVYAPRHFSYHCTSRKWAVENSTGEMSTLDLPGFQVQAFMANSTTSFGRAWDCTPFFTIPIWSGLFVSLIMLLILIWSMHMLASVPTPDKFDDPRGQPLHVPTSE